MTSKLPTYSFVIPIYNEEETLPELQARMCSLMERLDGPAEVIWVDDGSRDGSYPLMVAIHGRDERFKVAKLSRNFGHQTAITAGMDLARGEAVIIMDADLQDPPEVVLEMAAKWREGYEVVYAIREDRAGEGWFKKASASFFYRFLQKLTSIQIPADVGDFRLVDRKALEAFKCLRENNRYVRGMFSWLGFRQTGIYYRRAARFAGDTKYPLRKMLRLAINGIVSFSNVPLRLALNLGFLVSALSLLAGIFVIASKIRGESTATGWASLMVGIAFLSGVQLIVLGVIGEYIGRIHEEVKGRPLYIVSRLHGLEATTPLPRSVISGQVNELVGMERGI